MCENWPVSTSKSFPVSRAEALNYFFEPRVLNKELSPGKSHNKECELWLGGLIVITLDSDWRCRFEPQLKSLSVMFPQTRHYRRASVYPDKIRPPSI